MVVSGLASVALDWIGCCGSKMLGMSSLSSLGVWVGRPGCLVVVSVAMARMLPVVLGAPVGALLLGVIP